MCHLIVTVVFWPRSETKPLPQKIIQINVYFQNNEKIELIKIPHQIKQEKNI